VLGLFALSFLSFATAPSFASELDEIKAAIKDNGAKWVAGETSVSKLPPELRKMRVNLKEPKLTGAEKFLPINEALAVDLPYSLDWRAYGNPSANFVTPVRNQGDCGSCWAFGTTAALESYKLRTLPQNYSVDTLNLSEQQLVSCSGAGNCGGGYIAPASDYIKNPGLVTEAAFPYSATNAACPKTLNNPFERIGAYYYVATTVPSLSAIKYALNEFGPLVTTMRVYTDFFSYTSGNYERAWGRYEGGHVVLIVGYDDATESFLVKNSWGEGWGNEGYFNIAYSQMTNFVQFGYYTQAYQETPCSNSLTSTDASFPKGGGAGNVKVTSNCTWTANSNVSWIKITSGASGSGTDDVWYSVSPNTGKKSRTGTISIAGKTFTVTQSNN